ncbi:MAG: hypothetical protein Q9175_007578, partial [Cornicularia normoerica]
MDASVDELVSHPIDLNDAFVIRTASGEEARTSLCGLSDLTTYAKTYHCLKLRLELENSRVIYHLPFEGSIEHQWKLESVIASLSDAQFNTFVKILACSPPTRHRMYLGICAMLPRDLVALQEARADRLSEASNHAAQENSPWAFPQVLRPQIHDDAPSGNYIEIPPADSQDRKSIHLSFSIDDVTGAADLILQIALNMEEAGLYMDVSNIELLQRFARLSDTVSRQLTMKWMGKWPVSWQGIDEFTLDLRKAHGPDGVFLPSKKWLAGLNRYRNATPIMFKIRAPTKELEKETYDSFGLSHLFREGE